MAWEIAWNSAEQNIQLMLQMQQWRGEKLTAKQAANWFKRTATALKFSLFRKFAYF
jgi:hypothetical protein